MWFTYSVISLVLFAVESLASQCGGCTFDKVEWSFCSENAKEFADLQLKSVDVKDCKTEFSYIRYMTQELKSTQIDVNGKMGKFPIKYHSDDICADLEKQTMDGQNVSEAVVKHHLPKTCSDIILNSREIQTRTTELSPEKMQMAEGPFNIDLVFSKINGEERSACFRFEGMLTCEKQGKTVKKH